MPSRDGAIFAMLLLSRAQSLTLPNVPVSPFIPFFATISAAWQFRILFLYLLRRCNCASTVGNLFANFWRKTFSLHLSQPRNATFCDCYSSAHPATSATPQNNHYHGP